MTLAVLQLAGGVLPVLGQFVLPVLVGAVVVLVAVRDLRRRTAARARDEDEVLPLLIVPRSATAPALRPADPFRLPPAPPTSVAAPPEVDAGSETISIDLVETGTVQLLPGRLAVVSGMEAGREFRFVRAPGQRITEVTLGRSSGPPHRHVQLPLSTVSRMHARLRHEGGRWSITNLSLTNPVRVNDRELFGQDDTRPLSDGDRIRVGEVELRFLEDG